MAAKVREKYLLVMTLSKYDMAFKTFPFQENGWFCTPKGITFVMHLIVKRVPFYTFFGAMHV